jgi:hypothetical protein
MTADLRERIAALTERRVSAEEVRRAVEDPIPASERDDVLSLVHWFTRRYPTAADRLAYVRRAYARWRTTT